MATRAEYLELRDRIAHAYQKAWEMNDFECARTLFELGEKAQAKANTPTISGDSGVVEREF
jgi:hypothetical protein